MGVFLCEFESRHPHSMTEADYSASVFLLWVSALGSSLSSARCPRYVLALWLIVSRLSFVRCSHQPFFCPMATVVLCYVGGYQLAVFCLVWPSAFFLPDVHGGALLCWWLSACCLLVSVAISPFLARCPRHIVALWLITSHLPFVGVAISPFLARCPRYVFALCLIISQLSFA